MPKLRGEAAVTEQQRPSSEAASEQEERLPPEVQGESDMGQEPTVVPSPGAPSRPMDEPEEVEDEQ
jgi:hypothetical protein